MLVDANLLLYAIDERSPRHAAARDWFVGALTGRRRVGIPWASVGAFLRIATHPRVMDRPLTPADASRHVDNWFTSPVVWVPPATASTVAVATRLLEQLPAGGNLVPDAMLGALAIEHGLTVMTVDADFARLPGVAWRDPLAAT